MNNIRSQDFQKGVVSIVDRVFRYQKLLRFPNEGIERMLRGWLAIEVLVDWFSWAPQNIVFGESFDLLLVDDRIKPVVYIETKSLNMNITPSKIPVEIQKILRRTKRRPTLKKMILTNCRQWIVYDLSNQPKVGLRIKNIEKAKAADVLMLMDCLNSEEYVVRKSV